MRYYAGLDVSLAETSVCVVDEEGKILREAKVASEPEGLATWLGALGHERNGLVHNVCCRNVRDPVPGHGFYEALAFEDKD